MVSEKHYRHETVKEAMGLIYGLSQSAEAMTALENVLGREYADRVRASGDAVNELSNEVFQARLRAAADGKAK